MQRNNWHLSSIMYEYGLDGAYAPGNILSITNHENLGIIALIYWSPLNGFVLNQNLQPIIAMFYSVARKINKTCFELVHIRIRLYRQN